MPHCPCGMSETQLGEDYHWEIRWGVAMHSHDSENVKSHLKPTDRYIITHSQFK